ncbi:MAG: cbb3-type cytochrome c oxidase subunit I [Bdellovibrionales bacterium]|nr:cbb3-type cytochrome c oxidase subunit I [Bdellovibrionales bacterium]
MSEAGTNYLNHETGIWSWLKTIDHKRIGIMYLFSMFLFFFIAGIFAMLMRFELAQAGPSGLMSFIMSILVKLGFASKAAPDAQVYNVLFSLHGAMMVFLFIVPGIPATMGNFLLPLMIGAKDVAFPRLNLLSYYIYIVGALMAITALCNPIDTGWTFYTPYSSTTSANVILMVAAAFVLGFSSILTGLNFIVTIHKLRAPGMTWGRLPLFVWATYSTALIQVLATPVVGINLLLLIVERTMGLGIFDPKLGGDPVLFEHLFWFYSHPVVYIMILPAFGVIAEIIPVFSRKPIFGYKAVAGASLAIALVGFFVWAHHMFVAGISDLSAIIFSFITYGVAIPTAIKVFNWVSTMYKGSIRLDTPMLYAIGFIFIFMVAGTTGIYLAALATDIFYHDTYFVVAHFHYTMQGGAVIGLIAALHFWFPKMTGKMYNETAAKVGFVLVFFGFNMAFLPQFVLGMHGMPRRYFDYLPQFESLHALSTIGAFVNGFGYSFAIFNLVYAAFFSKNKAPANPYESLSLEWQTQSPPIHENFEETPVVTEWTYGYGVPVH